MMPDKCVHTAVILPYDSISYPLPDLVHVLGQDVMHVPKVGSQELLLRFSRAFLFLTGTQIKTDITFLHLFDLSRQ